MTNKRKFVGFIAVIVLLCFQFSSCCMEHETITYAYEELDTDLVKAEIVNCSTTNEHEDHIEVIKTLSNEECDYAITEITKMKFERIIVIGEP